MSDQSIFIAFAQKELERFVIDNDDLLELEDRIGRFNIFDALGVARAEIRHSNFLAWLIDPAESHGQGTLFLAAVLMEILRHVPSERRVFGPIDLDGAELRGVDIRREWRHIDLLIKCENPKFVIAFENKSTFGAEESASKLESYERAVKTGFPNYPANFIYLTPDGAEASLETWVSCAYSDIFCALTRCRKRNFATVGGDVGAFLDHYLRLIGSRFMNDKYLDELCRKVYKNHRAAIDLIVERGMTDTFEEGVNEALSELPSIEVLCTKPNSVWFLPNKLRDLVPENLIDVWQNLSRPVSIACWFKRGPDSVQLIFEVGKMSDPDLRLRLITALGQASVFKLTKKAKSPNAVYSRFYGCEMEAELGDIASVKSAASECLRAVPFAELEVACRSVFKPSIDG